jgi:hypothetical protein
LVHKDGFGSQSLTRLFEDANTSDDKFVFNKQYYDYLSKLDSREVDYKKLFEDELIPKLGRNDHLNDLRIRLAVSSQANYKFKADSELEGDHTRVHIYDRDGNLRNVDAIINKDLNPSDFTLWFP